MKETIGADMLFRERNMGSQAGPVGEPPREAPAAGRSPWARIGPWLVLAAVVAALFSPFLFKGWVLDGNHDRRDLVIPFHLLHQRAFLDFTVPHWNPYIFCGKNAHASAMYPIFYPPYWPAYLMGEDALAAGLTLVLLVHVLLGAWFAYLFFLGISADRYWSLVAAILYVLSSASVMQMTAGTINHSAFTWLPLLLYLVDAGRSRRALVNAALMAPVAALLILGANIQLAAYSLGIFLAYALWRAVERKSLAAAMAAVASSALGVGVSCAQLVPFWLAARTWSTGPVSYEWFRKSFITEPWTLLRLWAPEIFGARLHVMGRQGINHFEDFSAYVGVPGALIALFALLFLWNRKNAFFLAASFFILATVLGLPVLRIHFLAFGGSEIMYNRLAWFLPLCMGCLVALNARRVLGQRKRDFLVFSAGTLAVAGGLALVLVFRHLFVELRDAFQGEIRFSFLHLAAFGLASLAVFSLRTEARLFKAVFLVLALTDLGVIASIESGVSNPLFSPPPLFRFSADEKELALELREAGNQYRVLGIPWYLVQNIGDAWTPNNRFIPLGILNSSGYDNLSPAGIAALYNFPLKGNRVQGRAALPMSGRTLQLSSTRFGSDGHRVVEYPEPLPRLAFFTKYEVWPSPQGTLARITAREFPWRDTLLLDRDPALALAHHPDPGRIRLLETGVNRLSLEIEAQANALLLVNDTRDPGWEARLDGRRVPILSANYTFTALEIPRGSHYLEMNFTPQGWRTGLLVTCLSLAALAVTAGLALLPRRRGRGPDRPEPGERPEPSGA